MPQINPNINSNNVSFKAQFEGMNSEVIKVLFEHKTKADTRHKIVFVKGYDHYGDDKFELYKDGEKTAEYETEIVNERLFSIQRLMGIYNILKIKEAQAKVKEIKNNNK